MKHFIANRVVIVTGGSSGFGLETARILLSMGAKVVITGRNAERLAAAEKDLHHENLLAVQADATLTDDWTRLIRGTTERFEAGIDVLINNHGAGCRLEFLEDLTDEDIRQTLAVNLESVIIGCREAIKVMKPNGRGHIINVSSACANRGWPKFSVYTAAKAGLVTFTKCLHLEMTGWGGKATSFVPGAARTNFCDAAGMDSDWLDGYPSAAEFAHSIVQCVDVPGSCVIEELRVWGTKQVANIIPY